MLLLDLVEAFDPAGEFFVQNFFPRFYPLPERDETAGPNMFDCCFDVCSQIRF